MSPSNDINSIWLFNHYAITPDQPGGTRHYDLARELVCRGYQVVIFASSFSHRLRREMKIDPGQTSLIEDVNGVKFVWIKTYPYFRNDWRRLANMLSFKRRAQKLAMRLPDEADIASPDLVIGSSVHLFAVDAAFNVADHFESRFFMEVRDIWPQTLVDLGLISNVHPFVLYLRQLEKRLYKKAERMITPLPQTSAYFSKFGIDQDRILYLPQVAAFTSRPKTVRKNNVCFKVAYVGAFGPADDVGGLLHVAKLLENDKIQLIFVGDGEEKAKLVERARSTGLANVEFKEPVPKEEVPALLGDVDACLARYYDADARQKYGVGSNKLIDYMAAGKPIVLSGNQPNEIVAGVGCGISVGDDPRMVAEAIKTLSLMDSASLNEMGKLGHDYIKKNHSAAFLVDKLEDLWKTNTSVLPARSIHKV